MKLLSPRSILCALLLSCLAACPMGAFSQDKQPLDHDAYDVWNFIGEHALSDDGAWALWTVGPQEKDGVLHVKGLASDADYAVPRGERAAFTDDVRFAVFMIVPAKDSVRQAKLDDVKKDDMPKDSLGILDLASGAVTKVERVKSFKLPDDAGGWVAYLLEKEPKKDEEETPADTSSVTEPEQQPAEEQKTEEEEKDDKKKEKKEEGTTLVLRNLATGEETRFDDAVDYAFTKDGAWLVYTASNKEGDADGLFTVSTATGEAIPLMTGEGHYEHVALDEGSTQVAFVSDRDDYEADQPSFTLYHAMLGEPTAAAVAAEGDAAFPSGWWVSEHRDLTFSDDGTRLFFGTAPRPDPEPEDDDVPDDEKVKLDVWNWKDPYLQPMQLLQKDREQERSYLAVVHLDDGNRLVQLATETIPDVEVAAKGDADVALGTSDLPYRQRISWDWPPYQNYYAVDVNTGEARRLLEGIQSSASLSPDGRYLTWWDRDARAWFAADVETGTPINLTEDLPYPVYDEEHDWPYAPDAYGSAGWSDDDAFLVYDRYDVWALDPSGEQAPRDVTDGVGRDDDLRFRYVRLDRDQEAIPTDEPLLLNAFRYDTKTEGFYRDRLDGDAPPEALLMMPRNFSFPDKAEDAGRLMFTRESFREPTNLWVSDLSFGDMHQISDANPQIDEYRWGTAELVSWTSLDGIPLQGILYKPDGFDPSKQYPMMVYFYEKSSDGLYSHFEPQPQASIINRSFYVSRGYLLFVPDIPYKVGYPGESAMNAVMPGVTHLIEQGFVDRDHIGVEGHSWGGYQIAYMVTQTNLFAAAEAGAPVSDMVSAYGGIRWGSGMSRMFQYEKTQSRIGGSLWETPLRYIHNSPIFQADKVETPLLMMHNDDDSAVPWYQGIEMFVAMRRLHKPAWLVVYNGEPHNLRKWQNKKDWAIRMQQFFDHYLKGAPAPEWMVEGIPAVDKGKTLGLELAGEGEATPPTSDGQR